jgi:ABC-type transporter Mla maintaining outer membrane lipid asymmetry permease subunit MlaE
MNPVSVYIIILTLVIIFQLQNSLSLECNQFYEMVLGSLLIILFMGLFGSILLLEPILFRTSIYLASFYIIWYYVSRKIINIINTDKNGVLRN